MSVESVMLSNQLILCHPLLQLPSIFPRIRVFSNELALRIRWPRHWSFSFSVSPSSEYSGLISLRIDWFDDWSQRTVMPGGEGVRASTYEFAWAYKWVHSATDAWDPIITNRVMYHVRSRVKWDLLSGIWWIGILENSGWVGSAGSLA